MGPDFYEQLHELRKNKRACRVRHAVNKNRYTGFETMYTDNV
jgi:hypothetical protein